MTSYTPAAKGVQYIFYIGLKDQSNTKLFKSNPTIASGDFKVSIDGGALANPATLPAVTPASSKMVKVTLSTTEMNGDNITFIASDAAGAEWCDLIVNIQTVASGKQFDSLATQASVDDVPTNAELATALGTADDAVLSAIAALNNLSAAGIRTAIGLGSANLDTQLGDLPTNAELATALGTADDAVLAAIAGIDVPADVAIALQNYRLNELFVTALSAQPTAGSLFGDLTEDNAGTQRFTGAALAVPVATIRGVDSDTLKTLSDQLDGVDSLADVAQESATNALFYLQGLVPRTATIGATGNDTTHLHLGGLTYGDDEINNHLLVIYDVSNSEYHARWIEDWVLSTELATVATLPFTPQNGVDTYWLLSFRRDVTTGAGLDAAGVRSAVGLASANLDTQLTAIVGDTNELQTDWVNGGRLDLILDARASQTSVDDLPTNAELATALGTADDAVLAAIAALNNLSAAGIRSAVGLGSANLDTQLADLPTNAELATALGTADDAVLVAIAALNNLSSAQAQTAATAALNAYDPPTRAELTSDTNSVLALLGGLTLLQGTIGASGNDSTHLHLDGLTYGDDEINNHLLVVYDVSTAEYHARWIEDWVLSTELATVLTLPFTPQNSTDTYALLSFRRDVTTAAGIDAAGVRAAIGLAAANLDTQLADLPTNAELATALGTADDAVLSAIAALNNISAAGVRTAVGLGSANLDTQLADLPTNAELATALGTADDVTLAAIAALNNLSSAQVQTAATAALNAYDPPTKAELDAAVALLATQVSVNDLPTNAELATALGTADDATLAAIAALNNLSAAGVRSAIGLASANLDTQLADLPTNGELATALGAADDVTLAAIAALNNLSSAGAQSAALAALNAYDPPTKAELDSAASLLATQASVNDLPTNAELATALGTADDTVLAAIIALNNLSQVEVGDVVEDELRALRLHEWLAEARVGMPEATSFYGELVEASGGTIRFDAAALALSPAGNAPTVAQIRTEMDSNSTLAANIVLVKAKTDNLPSDPADHSGILAAIAAGGAGAGAIEWTHTITDTVTALPLSDVDVWFTSDVLGQNLLASGKTDQNGQVEVMLDAGTVYVWRQRSGVDFDNPDIDIVVAP